MKRVFSYLLFPFAIIYGGILSLRNLFYDRHVFRSISFSLPIISVGNLSVGGTGKTPMVEYLISLVRTQFEVATLSRGYNRRTKGYLMANKNSTAAEIGDEPMQFYHKFDGLTVSVGEDRLLAIPHLLSDAPQTQVILLDDAYQHRAVKPGLNILLTDYSNRFTHDFVVPMGGLREFRVGYKRADILVVTKCPETLSIDEKNLITQQISPLPHQKLFFTSMQYGTLYNFKTKDRIPFNPNATVLALCGIARPKPFVSYLNKQFQEVTLLSFSDHHYYHAKDLERIKAAYDRLKTGPRYIVTTEKDAARLHLLGEHLDALQLDLWILPIQVHFLFEEAANFNNTIFEYVTQHYE
jgi:tetraacyldisaccharide 4'-kinase